MENLWVGYSKVHGWVVLDHARNHDQSIETGMLIFKKYNVSLGEEYLESKNNWKPPQYIYGPDYIKQLSGQSATRAENLYQKLMTYEKTGGSLNPPISLLNTVFSKLKSMLLFIRSGYDSSGYNWRGYNEDGYNTQGYDKAGYNRQGFNSRGYSIKGYDRRGYDTDGYNIRGVNKAGYDREGYDQYGFNKDGLDKHGRRRYKIERGFVPTTNTSNYKKLREI